MIATVYCFAFWLVSHTQQSFNKPIPRWKEQEGDPQALAALRGGGAAWSSRSIVEPDGTAFSIPPLRGSIIDPFSSGVFAVL